MPTGPDDAPCVTFFFDRSIGKAVPKALRTVRVPAFSHDAQYRAQQIVPDETWIEEQTALGHVLVTKDKGIRHRDSEKAAIRSAEARLLVLTDKRATRLRMLRAIMIAWPKMMNIIGTEPTGPWIITIGAGGAMKKVL